METKPDEPARAHQNFLQAWRDVLLHPVPRTFTAIASAPQAGLKWACFWMALTSLLAWLTGPQRSILWGQVYELTGPRNASLFLVFGTIAAPILGIAGLLLGAGLARALARLAGGGGTFRKLAYTWAFLSTPFGLLAGLMFCLPSLIPMTGGVRFSGARLVILALTSLLAVFVYLYQFYASVTAYGALEGFGFWKALGLILILLLALAVAIACLAGGVQFLWRQLLTPRWLP
jgi:hypothetical protein